MRVRYALIVVTLAILPILAQAPQTQRGNPQRGAAATPTIPARPEGADWPMYNRDYAGTRFSPLAQIDTTNVTKLTKAWSYQLQPASGNINPAPALASEIFNEMTPIVVNGIMYMPSGNRVVALEPET